MGLQLRLQPTARARIGRHSLAEGPLISRVGVFLKQGRADERFEDKEAAEINTICTVCCPIPARVQGRCPGIRRSGIVERILRVIIPCKVKS
jgi:hypothetical protein